jgi:hypothetical protein
VTTPDFLYLALIAILLCLDHFVLWPSFLRRSQTDPARARLWVWSGTMLILWTLVVAGTAVWLIEARPRAALGLNVPRGWRLWVAIGLVLTLAVATARTVVRIARSRRGKRIKLGHAHVEKLSPHTRDELVWWVALSISAGFCEEFVFRGYLLWAFQAVLGVWGAAALSVVVFALAHAYQGARGIVSAGIAGILFTLVVLVLGSLLPAIALHALIDIGQGLVAWLVFRRGQGESGAAALS